MRGYHSMRKKLWLLAAVLGLAGVVIALWLLVSDHRQRTMILDDGTRVTYLGTTYGKHHTLVESRFRWGWPPVQLIEHRLDTPTNELRLWFRAEGNPIPPLPYVRSDAIAPNGQKYFGYPKTVSTQELPSGNYIVVTTYRYEGLPAEGQTVSVYFWEVDFQRRFAPRPSRSFIIRLPKAE